MYYRVSLKSGEFAWDNALFSNILKIAPFLNLSLCSWDSQADLGGGEVHPVTLYLTMAVFFNRRISSIFRALPLRLYIFQILNTIMFKMNHHFQTIYVRDSDLP